MSYYSVNHMVYVEEVTPSWMREERFQYCDKSVSHTKSSIWTKIVKFFS